MTSNLFRDTREKMERIKRAWDMVLALCKPRGSDGSREWMMSIPARRDYDPDLVIGDGLEAGEEALTIIAELQADVERLRKSLKDCTLSGHGTHWRCPDCGFHPDGYTARRGRKHPAECPFAVAESLLAELEAAR